jgi:hypothetical protein
MRGYINTISDMEELYYGKGTSIIQKSDAPVISTTTGVYNAVYGAQCWAMLNQEANAFGLMPKYAWTKSGWRIITARGASAGSGGLAEDSALPNTIKPTFAEVSTKPKTVAHTFSNSEVHEFLAAQSQDDATADMAWLRQYFTVEHTEHLNAMLLGDVDTEAGDNFESIDRVCSAKAEVDNTSVDANDADIYGLDRDGVTTHDAVVLHNSDTDRALTSGLLRTLVYTCKEAGAKSTMWLTGNDTEATINGLFDPQVRYAVLGEAELSVGVNGILTEDGVKAGVRVSTLYGLPLFASKDAKKDTISRVYLLDTSDTEGYGQPRLGIKMAKLPQYFEAGMNTGDPFGINKLGNEGMFRTMGELICTRLDVQGKIRDLL